MWRCLRQMWARSHRLQLMPQPTLSEVSGRGITGLDGKTRRRPACRCRTIMSSSRYRSEIARIACQNKAAVYNLLFKASAETLLTIVADPKHLGARIGMTSVLHTWGSALTHHPHVHVVVPGGGLSADDGAMLDTPASDGLLPAGPGSVAAVPPPVSSKGWQRCMRDRQAALLRRDWSICANRRPSPNIWPPSARTSGLSIRKGSVRRTRGCACLPLALYPQGRDLEQPLDRSRRRIW